MIRKDKVKKTKIIGLLFICFMLIPMFSQFIMNWYTNNNSNKYVSPKLSAPTIVINTPTPNQLFGSTAPNYNVRITDPTGVNTTWYTIDGGNTNTTVIVRKDILAPIITIDSPTPNQLFGSTAPSFSLTIDEGNLNITWYTIDGGQNNFTFTGTSGSIDQTAWNGRPNGTVTIRFYANDTFGQLSYEEVNVEKDVLAPVITIDSPTPNQLFGSTAPNFGLTIDEGNLNTTWYTIDGGQANFTFTGTSGSIDQTTWTGRPNGTVTIRFYANDTFGQLNYDEVNVKKDVLAPIITIDAPTPNQLFGNTAPTFSLTINEGNLNTTWYTIDGGQNNYTFTGTSGSIDQTAWAGRPNGTVTIRFYANDTLGQINYDEVTVRKDSSPPIITIDSPTPNQLFGGTAPTFSLTINDGNLNITWYTIDDGQANFTFTGTSGSIDQTAWTGRPNGTVAIRFYANDTFGHLNYEEVNVRKDVLAPIITIDFPIPNQIFGVNSPSFTLTIDEGNLNTTWYTIDGGQNNYTFTGTSGSIDQSAWTGRPNGTVTIRFYANDTFGLLSYEEVIVRKDIVDPVITIDSPTPYQLFGTTAPAFSLTIDEINLNTTWYTIDGGQNNYTFTGTSGSIDQLAWEGRSNGTVTIRFYVNDSAGNLDYDEVIVRKDILTPILTIVSPLPNQVFGITAPTFSLTINEGNLNITWYTIDGGQNNYTFTGTGGSIDQLAWEGRPNGTVTIRFYANDTFGQLSYEEVIVKKDVLAPIITIDSPTPNQLFGVNAPSFALTIIEGNLNITWYTIDGGQNNYTFTGTSGSIDQTAWTGRPNGTVTIRFYANDTLGLLSYEEVTVRKDIFGASITMNSPTPNQLFSSTAPTFDVTITGININTTWYTIDGGSNNYTFTGSTGTINQTAWNFQPNGTVTITFYINDSIGNLNYDEVIVRKDILAPILTIVSPLPNQLFGPTAPTYSLTVVEGNIDTMWYTFDGGINNYTFTETGGTINQVVWDSLANGTLTLRFYINDSIGNLGFDEVTIRRDAFGPLIAINSPADNQLFTTNAPTFDLIIVDGNLNTTWYTLDGGLNNYIFTGTSGSIDQIAWAGRPNGTVTIRFYANDTLGNLRYEDVIVKKDILAPIITINSPTTNQLFTHDIPTFDLTIVDGNLNITWYTLDGGITNYTFTGLLGSIDQNAWNALLNGTVTIRFYANDTLGNLGYSDVSVRYDKYTPTPLTLSSTADTPDTDGIFILFWTESIGADNYSIYMYNSPITELNSSVLAQLVAEGITNLFHNISCDTGTYYFIVVAYNQTGYTPSNDLMIEVDITTQKSF